MFQETTLAKDKHGNSNTIHLKFPISNDAKTCSIKEFFRI